jgi:hypothetical protein
MWPTWADIVSREIPDVDFYNFGLCGGGNLLISLRITEANIRYKFTEDDLIMVMWTTFCREDRYRNGSWMMSGNIFSATHDYSEEFIRKYADPRGYLIRDLAVMTQTNAFLKTIPATSFLMTSVPYDHQMEDEDVADVMELYKETTLSTPPSLFEREMNGVWENGAAYYNPAHCKPGDLFQDYHPNPMRYYNYLKKLGLPMTEVSLGYAQRSAHALQQIKTIDILHGSFKSITPSKFRAIL